jgi:Protein of unknown function (DUF2750)
MLRNVSQSAAHAAAWRREVRAHRELWTVEDDTGIPAPLNRAGRRAMPFWSARGRVEKVIASVPAYHDFRPFSVSLEESSLGGSTISNVTA